MTADVSRAAPLAGFGAGGLDGPAYDSLWQEVLGVSGVLGVILAAAVFVMLARRLAALRTVLAREDWQLACGAAVLAAGASAGIPSLTANRAATLLWLVLGALVTARSPGPGRRAHRRSSPPGWRFAPHRTGTRARSLLNWTGSGCRL